MTQSGQGEEPSARPAREGIVLPSDGGEPLLPGMTAGPVGPGGADGRHPADSSSAPSGGQGWGGAWGSEPQSPAPPPGQGWPSPPDPQWDARAQQAAWAGQGPGPLPPEGAPPPANGGPAPYGGAPAPQPDAGYGGHPGGHGAGLYGGPGAPLPPQNGAAYGAPAADAYGAPVSPEGATQYLPPVPGAAPDGSEGATQFLPPVPAGGDEAATQYIPPVDPGALPPEVPAGHGPAANRFPGHPDTEATQYIAPVTDQAAGPAHGAPPGDGDRQPPAEFDNLFRADGDDRAGSTQQLPRVEYGAPAQAPPPPSGGRRAAHDGGRGGGRGTGRGRTGSRAPLLAAVGVGIAVVGIGAGALLGNSGGDEDGKKQTVSATAPTSEQPSAPPSASPSVDPVRQQAVELDKLLAHSGDSRTAVINAVADVKACRNLDQAAANLRDAARQRNQLVTDLSRLSVDKLPEHEALTTALTKAWQASAAADDHYAAWADQVAGKKGCKKGEARTTGRTRAGNQASGTATAEKTKASKLWNTIAQQHGLPQRQPTQL
ncbi:hypothetical protein DKG34_09725 [Streptomyces sp. NWU49]|uniref:hypothetical protein n=1 Tax=Streptomyces sp. NWU49 TaxID=2201153 RepID=UPI000D68380F|nr:hypothetical protein [Streptomyces sp. NWU49]PWJ07708.1 hypothetical protein DKG34_09725 [Streptomyces sp. NWU49]